MDDSRIRKAGRTLIVAAALLLLLATDVFAQAPNNSVPPSGYQPVAPILESPANPSPAQASTRLEPYATYETVNSDTRPVAANDGLPNTALLVGFDGARGPDDLGINANVGGRIGLNTAFPIVEALGVGVQAGVAANYHQTATRFQALNGGPSDRTQLFSTFALFQRTEAGFVWGVAYDYLHSETYASLNLTQWRGQVGMRVNPCNEIGVWGTYRDRGDSAVFAGEQFSFRAINQANLYFTHFFEHNAMGRVWVGLADEHGRSILGIPGGTTTYNAFVYGAEFLVPVSPVLALYGEANLITPIDSGCVNAFVGVAIYPGGRAYDVPRSRFAPMFPVANNANFALDALR